MPHTNRKPAWKRRKRTHRQAEADAKKCKLCKWCRANAVGHFPFCDSCRESLEHANNQYQTERVELLKLCGREWRRCGKIWCREGYCRDCCDVNFEAVTEVLAKLYETDVDRAILKLKLGCAGKSDIESYNICVVPSDLSQVSTSSSDKQ
jgi:hypothetical protein